MRRTYREELNEGMSRLATTIEHVWGARCSMHEASCAVCHQWAVFDYMLASMDSMSLDDTMPIDDQINPTQKEPKP